MNYTVPTRAEVSEANQAIFDQLESGLGFVPNLYAYIAKGEGALGDYLAFSNRESSVNKKEKEVINLIVSQNNECSYCLSAHTVMGGMNGFNNDQIMEIRSGRASFDAKLDALAQFTAEAAQTNGKVSAATQDAFFAAGYTEQNLVDVIVAIGNKTIANYIHNATQFAIDFPVAQELQTPVHA